MWPRRVMERKIDEELAVLYEEYAARADRFAEENAERAQYLRALIAVGKTTLAQLDGDAKLCDDVRRRRFLDMMKGNKTGGTTYIKMTLQQFIESERLKESEIPILGLGVGHARPWRRQFFVNAIVFGR